MTTLAEIERAVGALSEEDKEELLRFLAMRLRKDRAPQRKPQEEVRKSRLSERAPNIRQPVP
jgi:hypothetical protein